MGKRGRTSVEDSDVIQGIVEGTFETKGYKRVQTDNKRVETYTRADEKVIITSEKILPITCNGGWQIRSIETIPKKEQIVEETVVEKFDKPIDNDSLPKTKRKYFNPENNKWIGYGRAVQLGLIK